MDLGLIILLLGDEEERLHNHNVMRIRKRRLRDTNCPLELPEEDFVRLFRPTAIHAFLRDNTVRRSLQPPYTGPYKILARRPTTITLAGRNHEVSVDRVKPATPRS
ncbi:putative gag-pol protein [Operophtera brumata]|uniref:Putative gag-pol protein n=1 Tax=Operophtera brumata TaxID=104452 RepID=A0A0L7LJ47_OPEBR|nr:putative gag-pol protein [Operophtera brumata]